MNTDIDNHWTAVTQTFLTWHGCSHISRHFKSEAIFINYYRIFMKMEAHSKTLHFKVWNNVITIQIWVHLNCFKINSLLKYPQKKWLKAVANFKGRNIFWNGFLFSFLLKIQRKNKKTFTYFNGNAASFISRHVWVI